MAAETRVTCPHCGANQGGTQFCAECGGALPQAGEASATASEVASKPADSEAAVKPAEAAPAAKPVDAAGEAKPSLARTMMGISAEQLFGNRPPTAKSAATGTPQGAFGGPAAAAPAAAPVSEAKAASAPAVVASSAAAKAPVAPGEPAADSGASAPLAAVKAPSPAEVVAAERPRRSLSKTMMGISPETLGALRANAAEAKPAAAPPGGPAAGSGAQPGPASPAAPAVQPAAAGRTNPNPMARTMLGLANPAAPAESSKLPFDASTGTMQGLPPVLDPSAVHGGGRGQMAKTMLGMAPVGPSSSGQPEAKHAGAPAQAPKGGRTMLGVPHGEAAELPRPPLPPAPPEGAGRESFRTTARDDERATVPPRREVRALWPLLAVTLVVVGLTLFLVLPSSRPPHVDVSAKIVSSETGEALLFEVPSAAPGSKIRFGGQEKPLEAGRASFALAADSLRVGDNLVLADVVRPDSEPAPVRITLAVSYRIWVDTAPLRAERSSLDVVVTAQPGTRVTLEGEELKLDAAGRGVRSFPVDVVSEAKSGVIDHVVHYRVQPLSGDTVVDELRTRIPVAMMQIDRPGREVITDRDSIEIAGAAGKDTQIHLDKTLLPVSDGRFLYRLSLPQPGEYKPRLVASAAGRAPLGVQLSIRRVKDLTQAAAQFVPEQDLTYAKLAPNPAIYKGRKISLEGRVYAVDPRGADSVIQMFVRPCPSSRRCPLWVSDPHGTDAAVDAWIRVLGVVQGEQQFRSEKNEIVTVPKVEAQFVLPATP